MSMGTDKLEGQSLADGRYLITAKLGEGGMGTVYRAQDRNIESDVVVKIPRPAMMDDPEFAGRFTREIRSLVKLSHPHIVKVSDVGTWDRIPFAVMQFLSGGSLEDRRPASPDGRPYPCDPKTVPGWLDAVAKALDYIHAQGYVHRDVKPGNILFDAEGHAFLSDFGVAKVLASAADKHASQTAMTGTGMVLGTPEYMAPELIMGDPFDGRADQYALAVTVYELLCGRRPFEDETKTKLLVLHTSKAPPRLTEWCPELPQALSQAVLKGLNKDPNDRYPNCAALAAAVAATTAGASAREGRVRFKCPSCGKTGGMPEAEYARARESGRRPACSACKVPLELLELGTAATVAGARSGGTMLITQSSDSGGYALASDPAPIHDGSASPLAATRGGTTAMSAPTKSQAEEPTDPEPRTINPVRSAQTTIQTAPTRSGTKTVAEISGAVATAVPESRSLAAPTRLDAGNAGAVRSFPLTPVQTWIAAGTGIGASVLGITVAGFMLFSRGEPKPPGPDPNTKAAFVASIPTKKRANPGKVRPEKVHQADSSIEAPKEPIKTAQDENAERSNRVVAAQSQAKRAEAAGHASGNGVSKRKGGQAKKKDPGSSRPSDQVVALNVPKPAPVAASIPRVTFNTSNLKLKPIKRYPLSKFLAKPKDYANQLVIPAGMFHLVPGPSDGVNSQRKFAAIERKIQNVALGVDSSAPVELEVEPRLAGRLDELGAEYLADKMSILTLWFNSSGAALLVKVDILDRYVLTLKKATYAPVGDIDYYTIQLSPDEKKNVEAIDEDWEEPERLLHFANNYNRRVAAYKKMLQTKQLADLDKVMGDLFSNMMKSAAANEAKDALLRRALTK